MTAVSDQTMRKWANSITRPIPNPFRQWATADIIQQQEATQWQIAGLPDECSGEELKNGTEFLEIELAEIREELARRERWKGNPNSPNWPGSLPDLKPFWEAIKDRVTVRDLWERHFPAQPLRKSGANWRQCCPICGSSNWTSFSIFANEQRWKCHVCHESGDVLSFGRWLYNDRSFHQAALAIADEFGIERPEKTIPERNSLGVSVSGINRKAKKPAFRALEFTGGKWG